MHVNRQHAYLSLMLILVCGGCAGYQVGPAGLYRTEIRTVHVPIFQSNEFRRNLGEQLTEAVVKEIESRTPYKVVHTPDADSVLRGEIRRMRKLVVAENRNDVPRDIEAEFSVEVQWYDRQGRPLMQRSTLFFDHSANFIPEAGQSMATAQQEALRGLARQIVSQMEMRW